MPELISRKFDLEERTAVFGERIIMFCNVIPKNVVTIPIISQLIRSGTSVGPNYCEADNAETRKDFIHKIGICRKEARETMHWLRMASTARAETILNDVHVLSREANELTLIFASIINRTVNNTKHQ